VPKVNIILGPPGTGKTHNLLNLVEKELSNGTPPDRIAFVSFTTKATNEARERAKIKFNLTDKDLPYFCTLHAFGKRQSGFTKAEIMGPEDYKELAVNYGVKLKQIVRDWDGNGIIQTDNKFIRDINKARMQRVELNEFYNKNNLDYSWYELLHTYKSLEDYKQGKHKYDFTDMLSHYLAFGEVPQLDVVIVDEAQDLSQLQWKVCEKIWKNAKRVFISGDDDQAIFRWAGADVEYLINMDAEISVLDQSYRCPVEVHKIAYEISSRIRQRREKIWKPREEEGVVRFHAHPTNVNFREGNWLVMATCGYMLKEIEEDLRQQGLPYIIKGKHPVNPTLIRAVNSWNKIHEMKNIFSKDVISMYSYLTSGGGVKKGFKSGKTIEEDKPYDLTELVLNHGLNVSNVPWDVAFEKISAEDRYYIMSLEKHGGLVKDPKINLNTVHISKGGECDNVMLLTDLSRSNQQEMEKNSDDTNRVFYVGATRAKQSLHIINPQRGRGFII
jgi:superfamily I DNA/RNA helicase|tara:strand:+ start:429 stop:1928 length:1500 start_codon:yes stop_codon:yes gene_type:complete